MLKVSRRKFLIALGGGTVAAGASYYYMFTDAERPQLEIPSGKDSKTEVPYAALPKRPQFPRQATIKANPYTVTIKATGHDVGISLSAPASGKTKLIRTFTMEELRRHRVVYRIKIGPDEADCDKPKTPIGEIPHVQCGSGGGDPSWIHVHGPPVSLNLLPCGLGYMDSSCARRGALITCTNPLGPYPPWGCVHLPGFLGFLEGVLDIF